VLGLSDFVDALTDELGDAADLVRDEQLIRWVNRGQSRLGLTVGKTASLIWAGAASSAALPADCLQVDRLVPDPGFSLPVHVRSGSPVGGELLFLDPSCVSSGSATLYYRAELPPITGSSPSAASASSDEAIVSFALACFFRRIASTRSDFKRYVAITGQSGLEVSDLLALADEHYRVFADARIDSPPGSPSSFYAE